MLNQDLDLIILRKLSEHRLVDIRDTVAGELSFAIYNELNTSYAL